MPIQFIACDKCGTIDTTNTASNAGGNYQCFKCLTGKWHDNFPMRPYNPEKDEVINRESPNADPTLGDVSLS